MNKTCGECKHLNRELAFCRACGVSWLKKSDGANCKYFDKPTPPTNGDKIRQMSNEELNNLIDCPFEDCRYKFYDMECRECKLEWLNAPAESEVEK